MVTVLKFLGRIYKIDQNHHIQVPWQVDLVNYQAFLSVLILAAQLEAFSVDSAW